MEMGIDFNIPDPSIDGYKEYITNIDREWLSWLLHFIFRRSIWPPTVHSLDNGRSVSHDALDVLSSLASRGGDFPPLSVPRPRLLGGYESRPWYGLNITVNALKKNEDFSVGKQ